MVVARKGGKFNKTTGKAGKSRKLSQKGGKQKIGNNCLPLANCSYPKK